MKILHINSHNFGSTGTVMLGIAQAARTRGISCFTACPAGRSMVHAGLEQHLFIGSRVGRNLHIALARATGLNGCFSVVDTYRFLRWLDRLKPDAVHLHNLHNCYVNLPMLFGYLKRKGIPVIWTLHDCWAFTGKCPHFDMAGCERWREGCHHCSQRAAYPAAWVDTTRLMWRRKRRWFTLPEKMTLVAPSHWLAGMVRRSFLSKYPVKVIPNGVDLTVFRPTSGDFRERYDLQGRYIVLGVAFCWNARKGLDVFEQLARRLDERFQIILVGDLPEPPSEKILCIPRLDAHALARIYTAADVFVNPTREEVQGMVNVEALACGTAVVGFRTGGSAECLTGPWGCAVDKEDIDALQREIIRICIEKPFTQDACLRAARAFDRNERWEEYCRLYEQIQNNAPGTP